MNAACVELRSKFCVGFCVLVWMTASTYTVAIAEDVPSVNVAASRDRIQIADPFSLTVTVKAASDAKVQFPQIAEQFGAFEIIERSETFDVPSERSDIDTWTLELVLETLETGSLEIPSLEIVATDSSGLRKRIASQPLTIFVESSIEQGSDPTAFHDIRDVIDAALPDDERPSRIPWTVIGVIASVAVAAAFGLLVASRRRGWMTPCQWAALQLTEPPVANLAHIEATFREFVQDEFAQPATSWTRDEMLHFCSEQELSAERSSLLQALLEKAQMEKFASLRTSEDRYVEFATSMTTLIDELHRKSRGKK